MHEIFIQNDDQRAIIETVQRFVAEEVTPRAAELDANVNPEDSFSWEIVERAHEVGIRQMTLAEQYGGLGTDSLTTSMVIEELGKGDLGVSVIFAQTLKIGNDGNSFVVFSSGLRGGKDYEADTFRVDSII